MTTDTKSLDERIAEHLGWTVEDCVLHDGTPHRYWHRPNGGPSVYSSIPPYSTDIATAWLLVEEMRKRGWRGVSLDLDVDTDYLACSFRRREKLKEGGGIKWYSRTAPTMPEAICASALVALNSTATHDLDPE